MFTGCVMNWKWKFKFSIHLVLDWIIFIGEYPLKSPIGDPGRLANHFWHRNFMKRYELITN